MPLRLDLHEKGSETENKKDACFESFPIRLKFGRKKKHEGLSKSPVERLSLKTWVQFFKTTDVVSQHFLKISNNI